MFSTNHALISIGIVSVVTGNPLVAFAIGFFSHFLVDIIPHGDTPPAFRKRDRFGKPNADEQTGQPNNMTLALIDVLILISLVLFLFLTNRVQDPIIFSATVVGGILPDIAWGGIEVFKIKWLDWLNRLHFVIHNLIPFDFHLKVGFSLQILLAVILYTLIYL